VEYVLPAAFVDRAALPLVLDPTIGALVQVTPAGGLHPNAAFDATNDVYLLVFTRIFSASDHDVHAQRWRAADGAVGSFGGGCGSGGTNRATCAVSPNANFTHRLRDSLSNAPALFVVSATRLSFHCGACTLVPDPNTGIMLSTVTNPNGDVALPMPVPAFSSLINVPFITQWVTLDLVSPACPVFSIEMPNALQVAIEFVR
jgi:hypothetical protein